MVDRHAILIVADDVQVGITGKITIRGLYTGNIAIPADPSTVPQLVFLFIIETDVRDPFMSMTLEITLPGDAPRQLPVVVMPLPQLVSQEYTRYTLRVPFSLLFPLLRPGHIEAKVIHDKGEIVVGTPWISVISQTVVFPPPRTS